MSWVRPKARSSSSGRQLVSAILDEHWRTGDRVPPAIGEFYPVLGGHEGAGVVVDVGPGVTTLQPGDHVCASFVPACGRCKYCAQRSLRVTDAH
jgi:Zn-dependent alcohol dehydrogenase